MSTSGMPEMSTHCPRAAAALGQWVDISIRPRVPMLQLFCKTFAG